MYSVMVTGMGKRGMHHAAAFAANPEFELVGACDIDASRLDDAKNRFEGLQVSTDAATLARDLKPDVFCFCTMPNVRLDMIRTGIECGASLIAFEKPVALTSGEGMAIRSALASSGVKAVVSHQHRYGAHYRKTKEIVASGAIGRVHTVYGTATGWMMHMLSHLVDYTRWFNDNVAASWVMGQAAGRGKFADRHPSPDYLGGFVHYENGVRGILECGAGAPDVPEVDYWWGKCRIGAQGTDGFAETLTGGGWRAVTRDGVFSGEGRMDYDLDMPPYVQEMADWLSDAAKVHQCSFADAYAGFEIAMGLCRSVAKGGQVALPLQDARDEMSMLRDKVSDAPVMLSMPGNAKEYAS